MDEAKHSRLPWAVHPAVDDGYANIIDARSNSVGCISHSYPSDADFIVLACNAYYSDQATIAAQAARIAWLERTVSDEEVLEAKNNYPELLDDHSGSMKRYHINTLLTAALEIRTKPENGEQ